MKKDLKQKVQAAVKKVAPKKTQEVQKPWEKPAKTAAKKPVPKTVSNTNAKQAQKNVQDVKFFGNPDLFKCVSKAFSEKEGWMKSTKVLQIGKVGCVIQVSTQQKNPDGSYALAEAICFVPEAQLKEKGEFPDIVPII